MEMSGRDVDAKPYLYSRNTIGHRNHNSNSKRPKRVKIVGVGSGKGYGGGMRKCMWAPEQNLAKVRWKMERWNGVVAIRARMSMPGIRMSGAARCPRSRARCSGSRSVDELDELRGEMVTPGQNSEDFVDGNCGDNGGKLEPHVAKQIHGSNPTKLHHTNKSQNKLGLFLVGIFGLGRKTTKSS